MDVLDHYVALPAELQWMIYNMLPRCAQRAMDNEPFEGDFLECAKQNHVGCVRHLIQTTDFNEIYDCIYDNCLLNYAVKECYPELLRLFVEEIIKKAPPCNNHNLSTFYLRNDLLQMPNTAKSHQVIEYVKNRPFRSIFGTMDYYDHSRDFHWDIKKRRRRK
jgi:hypothetical protein